MVDAPRNTLLTRADATRETIIDDWTAANPPRSPGDWTRGSVHAAIFVAKPGAVD